MDRKQNHFERDLMFDVDGMVYPSQVFERPSDVVNDPDLSLNEKRAILASWASDACAIEAAPALRKNPTGRVVEFDEIMEALRTLDREAHGSACRSKTVQRHYSRFGRSDQGFPFH